MKRLVLALAVAGLPSAAVAGPPFMTDDPEPTEAGHWEIYAPVFEVEGTGSEHDGTIGAEFNYGLAKDVQVTVGIPVNYARGEGRTSWGVGDIEASVKYRFYNDEGSGVQVAFFPGVTIPTAGNGMGAGHVTALIPVWAQKDFGSWSAFGGGGYVVNPGPGNQDYWTGGAAIARQLGGRVTVGIEANRDGPNQVGGGGTTRLGVGGTYDLPGPLRLLASVGPTLPDRGSSGFHGFVAVGLDI